MNAHMQFGQALASLSYAGRCPTWTEYETGSPAERRAILERWVRLGSRYETCSAEEQASAFKNYCRAVTEESFEPEVKPFRPSIEGEYESAYERAARGADPVGPDTSEDQGL